MQMKRFVYNYPSNYISCFFEFEAACNQNNECRRSKPIKSIPEIGKNQGISTSKFKYVQGYLLIKYFFSFHIYSSSFIQTVIWFQFTLFYITI